MFVYAFLVIYECTLFLLYRNVFSSYGATRALVSRREADALNRRQTERQTDGEADRRRGRQTDGQADRWTGRQMDRQADRLQTGTG